ncbi:hypothetical protein P12x_005920 [Tundrisphaera lichenicola]|uniref:hypothetical protein n=1 Tax=Tundrisphaera lichenicola TaxID=2029860 RepID=UPI003EBA7E01
MSKRELMMDSLEVRVLTAARVTQAVVPTTRGSYEVLHQNQGVMVSPITPGQVATDFVKGFQIRGIGKVSAAPVFIPHVATNGGVHDVWIVATQDGNLFKYDAHTGKLLGGIHLHYTNPTSGYTAEPVDGSTLGNPYLSGNYSITGTPAVRPDGQMVLLLEQVVRGHGEAHYVWNFLVVNPSTLLPTVVNRFADTTVRADGSVSFIGPMVPGTGGGSINTPTGPMVPFDARIQFSRTAIQLDPTGLVATVGFGANADAHIDRYHGYLFSFNTNTGKLVGAFNATPSGVAGSEWGSGMPVTLDLTDPRTVYATWSNGTTSADSYGDAVTGLHLEGPLVTANGYNERMTVLMVPPDYQESEELDLDQGSSQVTLVSPTEGITAGKSGTIFLFNTQTGQIDQTIVDGLKGGEFGTGSVLTTPAGTFVYFVNSGFNGMTVFDKEAGRLTAYRYDPSANRLTLAGMNQGYPIAYPGATPSISLPRDGNYASAILWVTANTSRGSFLAAFSAQTLRLIREFPALGYSHFMPPMINSQGQVAVNSETNGGGFTVWGPSASFARSTTKSAPRSITSTASASLKAGAAIPLTDISAASQLDPPRVKHQASRIKVSLR